MHTILSHTSYWLVHIYKYFRFNLTSWLNDIESTCSQLEPLTDNYKCVTNSVFNDAEIKRNNVLKKSQPYIVNVHCLYIYIYNNNFYAQYNQCENILNTWFS